jgi:polyhydroxyalkanoate synthase
MIRKPDMADAPGPESQNQDAAALARAMADIAERSQRVVMDFLSRPQDEREAGPVDPLNIGAAFMDLTAKMMADPAKLLEAQVNLWQSYMTLWHNTASRMMGADAEPVVAPNGDDRRFKDETWQHNPVFDYIKQSYLLTSNWITETVREVDGLDEKTAKKVEFYTQQFVDALAPTNFAVTNPEVLRATLESKGENLVKGLENLLRDLERGKGQLRITMTDKDAFKVGENIAITPGRVVFRNDLMELIQYDPVTEQVFKRPLLIMPPWINKFYILDLRPKNSFIKWAVEQGHTVFVVSWVNPDSALAKKSFEDYMLEAPLAALDAMEKATGSREANVIGYCLGGTLLASTLAYMAATGDDRIKSATFFVSLVDFSDPGDLGVFIDEEQLDYLESEMDKKGYLEGAHMATTFNMLRANDLIWSFVINNYLMGKDPFPFDLLYWNSDSTRMPRAMHSFYLRKMYQENLLSKPGGITLAGVPIDVTKVKTPSFFLSTQEDHIAPWKTTYATTQLFTGPRKFVLAGSGHIAGVVNHPDAKKYSYYTNAKLPASPDEWLEGAKQEPGSWWPVWQKWVERHGGGKVPARKPGDGKLKAMEPAPGTYVMIKAEG